MHITPVLEGLRHLDIPDRDNVGRYTAEFCLFWRRNLESFLTFVRGDANVPEASEIQTWDTLLRAVAEGWGNDWRGPHNKWAVIDAQPLNRGFPLVPPLVALAAAGRAPTQATQGRTQPPAPTEPSQPFFS